MLDPHERQPLKEILRPPETDPAGELHPYELDFAIGTTFSLDLETLLTIPLTFALYDWEDEEDRPAAARLAVLEALRRYASRMVIFCQAGQIYIPRRHELLFHYMEDSVIEVRLPHPDAVFHPKVWVLRWHAKDAPDLPVRYRLACLTRNLTFDRSWDTALVMDGVLTNRPMAINRPLRDMIAALPSLALRMPDPTREIVEQVQDEVRRVEFVLPEGFSEYQFWVGGLDASRRLPFGQDYDRVLVMSPFLHAGLLQELAAAGSRHVLVSRWQELEKFSTRDLKGFKKIYFLDDAANLQLSDSETSDSDDNHLDGLHAKLYLTESGQLTKIWSGSPNATEAGFRANVEFLVGLSSGEDVASITTLLSPGRGKERVNLIDLLKEYTPTREQPVEETEQEKLDRLAQLHARVLAQAGLTASVGAANPDGTFSVQLETKQPFEWTAEVCVKTWLISRHETSAVKLTQHTKLPAKFEAVSFEALTSFFAFEVHVSRGDQHGRHRFVLNLPLLGAPEDRHGRLIRYILQTRGDVLRYFFFLLDDGTLDRRLLITTGNEPGNPGSPRGTIFEARGLFEYLVRALGRDPQKLDQMARVVAELKKTAEGAALLPDEFDAIWEPIWAARQRLPQ